MVLAKKLTSAGFVVDRSVNDSFGTCVETWITTSRLPVEHARLLIERSLKIPLYLSETAEHRGDHLYFAVLVARDATREQPLGAFGLLSELDPSVYFWPEVGLLLVGSISTVYAFDQRTLSLTWNTALAGGAGVECVAVSVHGLSRCICVCEISANALNTRGDILWVADFGDVMRIVSVQGTMLVLRPACDDGRRIALDAIKGDWTLNEPFVVPAEKSIREDRLE